MRRGGNAPATGTLAEIFDGSSFSGQDQFPLLKEGWGGAGEGAIVNDVVEGDGVGEDHQTSDSVAEMRLLTEMDSGPMLLHVGMVPQFSASDRSSPSTKGEQMPHGGGDVGHDLDLVLPPVERAVFDGTVMEAEGGIDQPGRWDQGEIDLSVAVALLGVGGIGRIGRGGPDIDPRSEYVEGNRLRHMLRPFRGRGISSPGDRLQIDPARVWGAEAPLPECRRRSCRSLLVLDVAELVEGDNPADFGEWGFGIILIGPVFDPDATGLVEDHPD
jgi:hypothetical protein